jgi:hypothetical protein
MITPVRKPPGGELSEADGELNRAINRVRYVIERAIANLKTWRSTFTDYRRPRTTRNETLNAILGPVFYQASFS